MVLQPEERIDLARAAMLIAAEFEPELCVERALARFDQLAEPLARRLSPAQDDFQQAMLLTEYLFHELGFRGNEEDYYDCRNSLLNHVIERRLGIPISLSLVMMEIGARVGIPIEGIGFPGHFLVRHGRQRSLIFDPFHRGELLTLTECAELFARVAGSEAGFDPKYLAPAGPQEILVRLITNLKSLFVRHNQLAEALRMVDKLLLLHPDDAQNLRDRGLLKVQTGEVGSGIADLETYLESEPEPADQQTVEALIARARE
ncbi:MAG TPA: transglutaminase-like domain-containing protein, partial [Thermoanaerobaculia bacterium]|nr:transglutaminase-like domain-containing protein [Thermoanaerobaculia bacterium]